MNIERFIIQNHKLRRFLLRQATGNLIRPYVRWRKVPIIAITGTNGKTTVTRLLNQIYLSAKYRVGMACTDGVYLNGNEIAHGDYAYGLGVWKAIKGRSIDILIAETARGGIIRYGLGYPQSQVSIVTNIYEDHLGFLGINTLEQMAEVKSAVPYHTSKNGTVVLNGDQSQVRRMAYNTKASIIYFTVKGEQDKFDRCYYLHKDMIYRKAAASADGLLDVKTIPLTLQGEVSYNIANTMAAMAAVEGMQPWVPVSFETMQSAIYEFGKDPNENPTRLSFLSYNERYLLLCKCKNPESFSLDVAIIQKLQKKYKFDHVIGILTAVGDRLEEHYKKISDIVAPVCRYFFIRPPAPKYLRIRSGEEIVHLISAGIPKNRILSTENLSMESIFNRTQQTVNGSCLYVYFDALLEADLDIPKLIDEGQSIPIEIGEDNSR